MGCATDVSTPPPSLPAEAERSGMPSVKSLVALNLLVIPPTEDGGATASATAAMVAQESRAGEVVGERPTEGGSPRKGEKPAKKGKAGAAVEPFTLSDTIPLVPAKLVAKIRKGEYVDMAKLLRDNIEAERRQTSDQPSTSTGGNHSNRREVPDFLSWLQCFGVYASIVATHKPDKIRQLLAYQTLMIREARRSGGGGWQGYDSMFRHLAATMPSTDWGQLNSALYAVTFMAQQNGRGKTCQYCLETDHQARRSGGGGWQGYDSMFRQLAATMPSTDWGQLNSALYTVTFMAQQNGRGKTCQYCLETDHQGPDCALAPKKPVVSTPGQGNLGILATPVADTHARKGGSGSFGGPVGGPSMESRRPSFVRSGRAPRRRGYQGGQPPAKRACYAWNDGSCKFQERCRYAHMCMRCAGDHPVTVCKAPAPPPSKPG